ncbi:MAG: ABC transporter substrate-binding protein [Gordonia sp. (in: high G+C Gram-positive bacteria)]|nr:ABC transporter substrate-binding protein [Gordonia sp. (in: high G+C Gram-positive bacteria)]
MRTDLRRLFSGRRAVAVACAVALATGTAACGSDDDLLRTPDGSVISTTTTRFAEVNIVNPGRDYSRTCLAPTPVDAGKPDAKRIVVTDPALLDALCALGLAPQVRAIAGQAGSVPEYLGPGLAAVPTIGDTPTADQVTAAKPDLVLFTPETAARADAMRSTGALGKARVVSVDTDADWRTSFLAVAAATGRSAAGKTRIDEFIAEATRVGRVMDAAHSQVSLVRFTPDDTLIEGTSSFGAQIMAIVGVGRPAAPRTPETVIQTDANFTDADADLIVVSYQGDGGRDRGESVLLSDQWLDMGAPTWKRVKSVDDGIWHTDPGLASAWLVLNDLKDCLNSSSAEG